jgi:hypothetical protein
MGICGESRGIDVRTVDMYSRTHRDEKVYLRSIYSERVCSEIYPESLYTESLYTESIYPESIYPEKVYPKWIYSPKRCGMPIAYTNRHTKNSQIPTI